MKWKLKLITFRERHFVFNVYWFRLELSYHHRAIQLEMSLRKSATNSLSNVWYSSRLPLFAG